MGLDASAGIGAIEGDDSFLEQLAVLLRALEDEAELTVIGRWLTRRFLVRLLEVRFQIAAYLRSDPGVTDEVVAAPLFVTGAPRSGTTLLFGVLDCDPALRAPQGWELLRPVPPPRPENHPDVGRVMLADRELRQMQTVVSALGAIHEYGGRMPKECVSAMSLVFLSEEFTARYRVPSYAAYLGDGRYAPGLRSAPVGAATPATPLRGRAVAAEVTGPPAFAAHPPRRVSRRPARRRRTGIRSRCFLP